MENVRHGYRLIGDRVSLNPCGMIVQTFLALDARYRRSLWGRPQGGSYLAVLQQSL
jgi:hypothetical protein